MSEECKALSARASEVDLYSPLAGGQTWLNSRVRTSYISTCVYSSLTLNEHLKLRLLLGAYGEGRLAQARSRPNFTAEFVMVDRFLIENVSTRSAFSVGNAVLLKKFCL